MIKLIDILKEIADNEIIWYHGSVADINQNDLDPLHRESEKYKGDTDKQKWDKTGSSGGGVGIYFGKDKDSLCSTCPMQYTGFYNTSAPWKQGFMYEMKLKPNSNIKKESGIANISKTQFENFRKEGVDALIDGSGELNLLNTEAIQYFKKIMQWREVPILYPVEKAKPQKDKGIKFDNNEKLKDFLQNYDMQKVPGKFGGERILYLNKERNGQVFEYDVERKWFNL